MWNHKASFHMFLVGVVVAFCGSSLGPLAKISVWAVTLMDQSGPDTHTHFGLETSRNTVDAI